MVYFVICSNIDKKRFDELQRKSAYELNIVQHNAESDISGQNFNFIISDQSGVQTTANIGLQELTHELLQKTRIRDINQIRLFDCQ